MFSFSMDPITLQKKGPFNRWHFGPFVLFHKHDDGLFVKYWLREETFSIGSNEK